MVPRPNLWTSWQRAQFETAISLHEFTPDCSFNSRYEDTELVFMEIFDLQEQIERFHLDPCGQLVTIHRPWWEEKKRL